MPKKLYRTQEGPRPDLNKIGAQSQLDVGGYAFPKLFPMVNKSDKSGEDSIAAKGLTNEKGVKGRANGSKLGRKNVPRKTLNWSVTRYEGRGTVYADDGSNYTSDAAADKHGAETAQRQILNLMEQDAFNVYFNSSANSSAVELKKGSVVKQLQQAAKKVRAFGKPYLVMTSDAFDSFCDIPEVQKRINTFSVTSGDIGFLANEEEKIRTMLAGWIKFKGIIVFDSDCVVNSEASNTSFADNLVMVVGLRKECFSGGDAAISIPKDQAVQGIGYLYIPETDVKEDMPTPFDFYAWFDKDAKENVYDAEAFAGFFIADATGHKMFKFAASYADEPAAAAAASETGNA